MASLVICGICREEDRSLTLLCSDGLWRSLSERERSLEAVIDVQVDAPNTTDEAFTYDNVGNRLTEAGIEGDWTYNDNNELLTFANVEYTYDSNGNMVQKKLVALDGSAEAAINYDYNAADRLVRVEDNLTNTVIAEYYYDPFGRRLWKDVGGTTTYFFYADEGLVAEYDDTGVEQAAYGYKPNSTWTTNPLWLKQDGVYYFYQNDHLGTPQKLVGVNGGVVWAAQYTAFGKAEVQVEAVVNNLRFPGQYYDAETGLHYNRFRYYNSKIGRYLRTDPVQSENGGSNFLYSLGNPLIFWDPLGLLPSVSEVISWFAPPKCCNTKYWDCVDKCKRAWEHWLHLDIITHAVIGTIAGVSGMEMVKLAPQLAAHSLMLAATGSITAAKIMAIGVAALKIGGLTLGYGGLVAGSFIGGLGMGCLAACALNTCTYDPYEVDPVKIFYADCDHDGVFETVYSARSSTSADEHQRLARKLCEARGF